MASEFSVSEKRKLVDLARAIVERAQAAAPLAEPAEAAADTLPALELHQTLDPKAVIEFAMSCHREMEATRRHCARQLDAMLLLLERFEVQFTMMQGELDGVRAEQRVLLDRVADAEQAVRSSGDELVAQLSQRFLAHLEQVDRAASELIDGRKQFAEATTALLAQIQG